MVLTQTPSALEGLRKAGYRTPYFRNLDETLTSATLIRGASCAQRAGDSGRRSLTICVLLATEILVTTHLRNFSSLAGSEVT